MFCEKCGSELKENAKFCEKCGTPVKMPEEQATAQTAPEGTPEGQAAAPKTTETAAGTASAANPLSGMPKKKLGMIGGAAVVVILLLVLIFGRGKTIDLTPYVSVEFSGVEKCENDGKLQERI